MAITTQDARSSYSRNIEKRTLTVWERAYQSALADKLDVKLPYGEKGKFNPGLNVAYSYNVGLQEGEVLVAEIVQDQPGQRVFIEILEYDSSGFRSIAENRIGENKLAAAGETSGLFKVIIQPEAGATGNFFVSLNKKPMYLFPVAGKGNAAIQSFWGAVRDGGKRSHEGVDIFAKKGTPVVAVSDGTITRACDQGIGGKQVWLRTGIFGKSVYYAHLDEIAVQSGTTVKMGDTLGFIGNSGNAKGGAHHLHFGVYAGYGAVNPLPFIFKTQDVVQKNYPRKFVGNSIRIKAAKAILRQGPSTDYPKIGEAAAAQEFSLLGQAKDWLHIQAPNGQKAFVHSSLAKV